MNVFFLRSSTHMGPSRQGPRPYRQVGRPRREQVCCRTYELSRPTEACNYDVEDESGTSLLAPLIRCLAVTFGTVYKFSFTLHLHYITPAQQRDNNHYLGKIKELHHAVATVSCLYASAINSIKLYLQSEGKHSLHLYHDGCNNFKG